MDTQYLYLTTIGRKTGRPHEIEIWFVAHDGRWYCISEMRERSDWVRNIAANPRVTVCIGSRDAPLVNAIGRMVDAEREPELAASVRAKMDAKYGWSEGLIIELTAAK